MNKRLEYISPENFFKVQILLKKSVSDFNYALTEILENYESLEYYSKKKIRTHQSVSLPIQEPDQCKRRNSL